MLCACLLFDEKALACYNFTIMKTEKALSVNKQGHLCVGGVDVTVLKQQFGTPLYILDETTVRETARAFKKAADAYGDATVAYASKALSCVAIYEIAAEEGLGADVVSGGELLTALSAGMSADKLYFHGNNKQPYEIESALGAGVHALVSDTFYELELIDSIAEKLGVIAPVMLRVNPGVEAHTHQFIQTARVDSKFGFGYADGDALLAAEKAVSLKNIKFIGLHCHIGSQIFEVKPFVLAVERMTDLMVQLKDKGIAVDELNMGGGYGVTYTDEDKPLEPQAYVSAVVSALNENLSKKNLKKPRLVFEPGRSIVGEAGVTLYTAGAVKEIKDVKTYVSVDGGMFENPRYALYQAKYEAVAADRMNDPKTRAMTVAGKCCESGDMLVIDAQLPDIQPGNLIAVLTTGAYNYSMAGNYNRNPVPPMVLVSNGRADYIVKPQSYEDLMSRDVSIRGRKA